MAEYNGCELPEDLWYDLDYLWARPNDDGTLTLGLTDPAQTMAGRVVAATFRKLGTHRDAGRSLGSPSRSFRRALSQCCGIRV